MRIRFSSGDDVRAKFKFGGNVDDEHRAHVAARLLERDDPGDRAAASHMKTSES